MKGEEVYMQTIYTLDGTPCITNGNKTMEQMVTGKIFGVFHNKQGFFLGELCEEYYIQPIDKTSCLEIAEFFKDLAEKC